MSNTAVFLCGKTIFMTDIRKSDASKTLVDAMKSMAGDYYDFMIEPQPDGLYRLIGTPVGILSAFQENPLAFTITTPTIELNRSI